MSYHSLGFGESFSVPTSVDLRASFSTTGAQSTPDSPEVSDLKRAIGVLLGLIKAAEGMAARLVKTMADTLGRMNKELESLAYAIRRSTGRSQQGLQGERAALLRKRASYMREQSTRQAEMQTNIKRLRAQLAEKQHLLELALRHQADVAKQAEVDSQARDIAAQKTAMEQQSDQLAQRERDLNTRATELERQAQAGNEVAAQAAREIREQQTAAQQERMQMQQAIDRQAQQVQQAQQQLSRERSSSSRTRLLAWGLGAVAVGAVAYAVARR